jgi:hypothetical protein
VFPIKILCKFSCLRAKTVENLAIQHLNTRTPKYLTNLTIYWIFSLIYSFPSLHLLNPDLIQIGLNFPENLLLTSYSEHYLLTLRKPSDRYVYYSVDISIFYKLAFY